MHWRVQHVPPPLASAAHAAHTVIGGGTIIFPSTHRIPAAPHAAASCQRSLAPLVVASMEGDFLRFSDEPPRVADGRSSAGVGTGVPTVPPAPAAQPPPHVASLLDAIPPWQVLRAPPALLSAPGAGAGALSDADRHAAVVRHVRAAMPACAPLLYLHEEVRDFVAFMEPTPVETEIADHAIAAVVQVIKRVLPSATIDVFGSRATGLVLPTSDWDIVLLGIEPNPPLMNKLAAGLQSAGVASHVEVIAFARVPIIKLKEKLSGIGVDISFGAESGPMTREMVRHYIA
ncbi:hypothetical protein EON67_09925, partial [archaeon]